MLAYTHDWIALTHGGAAPDRIYMANVSANFFDLLGGEAAAGALLSSRRRDAAGCRSLRCAESQPVEDAVLRATRQLSANHWRSPGTR